MNEHAVPISLEGETVRWAVLTRPLREPFFDASVARQCADGAAVFETGLDALMEVGATQTLPPRGFIFHMSRCGSTLVANALRAASGTRMISEPRTISQLLESPHADNERMLRALVAGLGRPLAGERALVFKLMSANVRHHQVFRRAFPDVPVVFLSRDPLDLLVSVLRSRPGWLLARGIPDLAARMLNLPPAWIADGPDEMYAARVLGAMCDAALLLPNPLVDDYSTLTPATIHRICGHFGVRAPTEEALAACFAQDSKKGGSFVAREMPEDVEGLRAKVEQWTMTSYRRVLALARP